MGCWMTWQPLTGLISRRRLWTRWSATSMSTPRHGAFRRGCSGIQPLYGAVRPSRVCGVAACSNWPFPCSRWRSAEVCPARFVLLPTSRKRDWERPGFASYARTGQRFLAVFIGLAAYQLLSNLTSTSPFHLRTATPRSFWPLGMTPMGRCGCVRGPPRLVVAAFIRLLMRVDSVMQPKCHCAKSFMCTATKRAGSVLIIGRRWAAGRCSDCIIASSCSCRSLREGPIFGPHKMDVSNFAKECVE